MSKPARSFPLTASAATSAMAGGQVTTADAA
jgi:hypothetical protein